MGHFGILELFNIDQDPKDSNVHPCLIRYFYHILQCLFLGFYEKNPTIYFSFGTKYANMENSKQKETWILFYYILGSLGRKDKFLLFTNKLYI